MLSIIPLQLAIGTSVTIGVVVIVFSTTSVTFQVLLTASLTVSFIFSGTLQVVYASTGFTNTATAHLGALARSLALVLVVVVQISVISFTLLVDFLLLRFTGIKELAQSPVLTIAFDYGIAIFKNLFTFDLRQCHDFSFIGSVQEFALEREAISIIKF